MPAESVLVRTKGLCKDYGSTRALDRLSFSISRGEVVGLLGANGAGKTTAIHVLLGLLTPTSGVVEVFGLSPLAQRTRIAARLNFSSAYVNLPSNLKTIEALRVFSRLYAVRGADAKIASLLDLLGIARLRDRVIGGLSSGEKTRLNLAKALLNDPELLLLDEPTASLDPDIAETVRRTLKEIQKRTGMGILYTSHNMPEVEKLCDRVLFLHKGKLITEGAPAEVVSRFSSGSLEELFIKIVRGDVVAAAEEET